MYIDRFSEDELAKKREIWSILVSVFFQQYLDNTTTVLDIGCGWGEFINFIKAKNKFAIDVSDQCKRFLMPDVKFSLQSCCEISFRDNSVDVIFASNLFEHLPARNDVCTAIKECYRVLRSGGTLLILQPNYKFCYKEYFDFFDHYQAYTDRSMEEILRLNRFSVIEIHPRFLPFSTKQRLPQSPFFVKLYLKLPFLWKIFGKQMFIVAQKP